MCLIFFHFFVQLLILHSFEDLEVLDEHVGDFLWQCVLLDEEHLLEDVNQIRFLQVENSEGSLDLVDELRVNGLVL